MCGLREVEREGRREVHEPGVAGLFRVSLFRPPRNHLQSDFRVPCGVAPSELVFGVQSCGCRRGRSDLCRLVSRDRERSRMLGTLNCMQSHILPKSESSMASVQTIVAALLLESPAALFDSERCPSVHISCLSQGFGASSPHRARVESRPVL